jgi:DNA-binding beta-propeller fold protein YncE
LSARKIAVRFVSISIVVTGLAFGSIEAAPEIRSVELITYGPSVLDPFVRPLGLAVDPSRQLLVVADTGNHRLVLMDASGRSRGSMICDAGGTAAGACEPRAVAFDPQGRLYVLDSLAPEIEVRTPTGTQLARFDPLSPDPGGARPQDLDVGPSGRIYIVYAGERAGLLVVEPRGHAIATVLRVGFETDGPFSGPAAVAVNASETAIAIVDPAAEKTVLVFDTAGVLQASFGAHGEGDGTFSMAAQVTWGPGETLWVTDQIRHSVSVFEQDGTYLGNLGGYGTDPGQFYYPIGVAFLAPDRLAVLERAGARLQVLAVDVGKAWEPQTGLGSEGSGESGASLSAEVN